MCLSDKAVGWISIRQSRPLLLQGSESSTLCFDGEGLQACVTWRFPPANVLSVDTISRFEQRVDYVVFKAMFGEGVCRWPFSLRLSSSSGR